MNVPYDPERYDSLPLNQKLLIRLNCLLVTTPPFTAFVLMFDPHSSAPPTTTIMISGLLSVLASFALSLGSARYGNAPQGVEACAVIITVFVAILHGLPDNLIGAPWLMAVYSIPPTLFLWNACLQRAGLGRRAWALTIRVGDGWIPTGSHGPQWPLKGWEMGFWMMEDMWRAEDRRRAAIGEKSVLQEGKQAVQAGGGPSEKLAATL
ncbi:hypothetical protein C8J57DRAFT_1520680 [Mycena rebaudengoi]|nr:hypothetical protein C8J57DRAFT_1520680 [Mycena rebaudengoi]